MTEPLDLFIGREMERNDLRILPIEPRHAAEITRLPFFHRDPFDRMLVAQAITEKIPVISADLAFDFYGIERLW